MVWSHVELEASAKKNCMHQAVLNSHRTDVEEWQGCSSTQRLMAETGDHAQLSATPRGVRSVELADTMGAQGTSVEVESALRAAVSPVEQEQRWTMPAARWWDLTHQDYAGEHLLQGDGPTACPWEVQGPHAGCRGIR